MNNIFQIIFDNPVTRLADIELFFQVIEHGSITAAARQMGISTAVASKRLQGLEQGLGVRLLHRSTRKVSATTEGLRLLSEGKPLLEQWTALAGQLSQSGKQVTGNLRVSAGVSFGRHFLSPLLPQFLKRYPGVSVQLHLSDEKVDLVEDGFDLAIRIATTMNDSDLVAKRLAGSRRFLCASPAYLQHHGAPQTLADLHSHNCLVLSNRYGKENPWQLSDRHGNRHRVPVTGSVESNLGDALRDAALSGLGIALQSIWHIDRDLKEGRLQRVLPEFFADAAIYALMPGRQQVPARVGACITFLQEQLKHYAED